MYILLLYGGYVIGIAMGLVTDRVLFYTHFTTSVLLKKTYTFLVLSSTSARRVVVGCLSIRLELFLYPERSDVMRPVVGWFPRCSQVGRDLLGPRGTAVILNIIYEYLTI